MSQGHMWPPEAGNSQGTHSPGALGGNPVLPTPPFPPGETHLRLLASRR